VAPDRPRLTRIILWLFIVFNLAIALVLALAPAQVDAEYQGGAMTPTRRFMWFSIASFHLFMVGVTLVSLKMRRASERRWLHLLNAGFYLWDAATQWLHWGAYVGVSAADLHKNAGVSAICGLLVVAGWWLDKDAPAGTGDEKPGGRIDTAA
jgi:hypothetical protein